MQLYLILTLHQFSFNTSLLLQVSLIQGVAHTKSEHHQTIVNVALGMQKTKQIRWLCTHFIFLRAHQPLVISRVNEPSFTIKRGPLLHLTHFRTQLQRWSFWVYFSVFFLWSRLTTHCWTVSVHFFQCSWQTETFHILHLVLQEKS